MQRPAALLAGSIAIATGLFASAASFAAEIPRPEHPRPEAVRAHWASLNGPWQFRFDPGDKGLAEAWFKPGAEGFDRTIVVPFPWESELSTVKVIDGPKVAWYRRSFEVPADFPKGDRVILRFEAVDYRADVWVDGKKVAEHEGGYSPFEADVTEAIARGKAATVVVRAFDPTDPELPTGKQVGWYTPTSGIWQTAWLESRPSAYIRDFAIRTDLPTASEPRASVNVAVKLGGGPAAGYRVAIRSGDPGLTSGADLATAGDEAVVRARVASPKLWTPETPHLYDARIELIDDAGRVVDSVATYFGIRTITRGKYGESPYERLLLNGKPVYLRSALDQSFNPKGIYTAPDDDFLKRDLLIAKENGLNGLRIHIKPDEPRRLYWADKIGLLILEDMPNTWRQTPKARKAWESTMREVVARDKNHPSIVAWIAFNETWGLGLPPRYKADKETQGWVKRMVATIRGLDPTRLVEDNSPCNDDHVEGSDLNSWHFYIDDHDEAARHVAEVVARTTPGSDYHFCPGEKTGTAPLINSEYGGIGAGSGDRDVAWAFKDLTNLLRHQGKIQGYVYTELSDIEWEHNGFVNYDRTPKRFGYDSFLPDLRPFELNGADFVGYGGPPAIVARPGETITVPVFISHFSDRAFEPKLRWWLDGLDDKADLLMVSMPRTVPATWKAYEVVDQVPITVTVPDRPFVGSLNLTLRDPENRRIAANYVNVVVRPGRPAPRAERADDDVRDAVLRFEPGDFARQSWTAPGPIAASKASGAGAGYFEYRIKVPKAVVDAGIEQVHFQAELASKSAGAKVDWPARREAQDLPQTDVRTWPTSVQISYNGTIVGREEVDDDPADARGVQSHLAHRDAGSFGEVVSAAGPLPEAALAEVRAGRPLVIRLAVPRTTPHSGGLTVFGESTGRLPMDPTLTFHTKEPLPDRLGLAPGTPVAIDSAASRVVSLVKAGDTATGEPARWSYTTDAPAEGWERPGFDATAWKSGPGGFGSSGTPALRARTGWSTRRIALRTEFDLARPPAKDDLLRLRVFHDEDVEVALNGRTIFRGTGYSTDYADVTLDDEARSALKVGKNLLTVSCRQTTGGQGVDVGLEVVPGAD